MAIVRYMVNDVERAISFYVGHLGFKVKEQYGTTFAMITKDDLTLWLSGPQTSAAQPMPDGAAVWPGSRLRRLNSFSRKTRA